MIALSGVRSSCDMLARNSVLCRLAASSCRLLSSISRNSRAFWMASADCVAKVFSRSMTSGANSPGALPVHDQPAEQVVLAQQRHRQQRPVAQPDEDLPDPALVAALVDDVADLRPARRSPPAARARLRPCGSASARSAVDQLVGQAGPSRAGRTPRAPRRTRRSTPPSMPASWVARETIVLSTVSRSSVELTAWPTSPSAFSSPTERVSSAVRASQLLEQPHVLDGDHRLVGEGLEQRDLLVGERPGLVRGRRRSTPIGLPSRSIGTARHAAEAAAPSAASCVAYSGSASTSGMCDDARASGSRARRHVSRLGAHREDRRSDRSMPPGSRSCERDQVDQLAVEREDDRRARRRTARSALARWCRTPAARRSASWLITRRISLVAVCCSSASVRSRLRASSSLNSRTFSIAITAWSAKVWSSAICVVGERPGLGAADRDGADRAAPRAAAARPGRCGSLPASAVAANAVLRIRQHVGNRDNAARQHAPGSTALSRPSGLG